jgi:membrane associated rhomboid family serine protease
VLANPNSAVPSVGASGAIAGVLGAYLVLYPRASVRTLIPIIIIPWIVRIPAFVLMLFWFALQVIGSTILAVSSATGGSGGVAYMAHIVGFLLGAALVFVFRGRQKSIDVNQPY